jgi:AbrB family looped-hinge helix DNA binding protein
METTRLSKKGQIILPKSIRVSRDWKPGTAFTVEEAGDGVLLRPAAHFPAAGLEEVAGLPPVQPEIENACANGRRHRPGSAATP